MIDTHVCHATGHRLAVVTKNEMADAAWRAMMKATGASRAVVDSNLFDAHVASTADLTNWSTQNAVIEFTLQVCNHLNLRPTSIVRRATRTT